ncbi:MAG: aminodeoxychorismate synthase component I [Lutibacter sp.]|uniref:aminodeoxychorismate synthase component I n=1 Tax=Lutibacter sp. TaxID=1925666 RepID=UPI0018305384|nr:aminodeoxychorismate synthase component I [Lutibacter sp.]MBT8317094.1 aminodeoxychorismate synthase component I [Lutibacter sp.]NNJ57954.1 aminodeoxychorismate synthase component I [Lutibacter sp.]
MQRTSYKIHIDTISEFKTQLLQWAQQFKTAIWLDSNNYPQKQSSFDAVLAVDTISKIETSYTNAFQQLKEYQSTVNDYIFGYLGYDLKNDVENLTSSNYDGLHFSDLFFFQPKKIFLIKDNMLEIKYVSNCEDEIDHDLRNIQSATYSQQLTTNTIKIKLRIHKDEYYKKLNSLLNHIHRGDIYEANFCQEFYSENTTINPLEVYQSLNEISTPPFATFLKTDNNYLLSASPERYLKKEGELVISQPIKGTEKRANSKEEDLKLIKALEKNPKERAENIMIVDLVRNDLSRFAIKRSVKVDELCKVYTFKQVHQLISTVSCKVKTTTHPVDIVKATFPMGSMTGAPKISALKIIEELEETKRGLYSGAVGYFTPTGDFDFNVIIRSILYNATKKYVSYSVGGAITAQSTPEKEYEECLLKAKAMKQVLLNTK